MAFILVFQLNCATFTKKNSEHSVASQALYRWLFSIVFVMIPQTIDCITEEIPHMTLYSKWFEGSNYKNSAVLWFA